MSHLNKFGGMALALAMAFVIASLDYATGYDVHLTSFYLIPICLAGWKAGQKAGLFLALLCAVLWLIADLTAGHPYLHSVLRYWNALMLLVFFTSVVFLFSGLQRKTAALQAEMQRRERLEEANLRAERLATVGTMAAQVAHEVRNPLGSITLNLDLMAKEIQKYADATRQPAEEGRALLNEIREEVGRIQSVIEDYLRFARLRKPQRKTLNLNEFIEQKLAFMGSALDEARVQLRTEFDASSGTINADDEQLWQALLNLVRNSLEAMPEGGTLTVGTLRQNDCAVIRLADTGRGMNAEQAKQLFTPFFTTKPQGTGLGLPLAEQILGEHGARIECASTVGKGTTFTIYFPLGEKS